MARDYSGIYSGAQPPPGMTVIGGGPGNWEVTEGSNPVMMTPGDPRVLTGGAGNVPWGIVQSEYGNWLQSQPNTQQLSPGWSPAPIPAGWSVPPGRAFGAAPATPTPAPAGAIPAAGGAAPQSPTLSAAPAAPAYTSATMPQARAAPTPAPPPAPTATANPLSQAIQRRATPNMGALGASDPLAPPWDPRRLGLPGPGS